MTTGAAPGSAIGHDEVSSDRGSPTDQPEGVCVTCVALLARQAVPVASGFSNGDSAHSHERLRLRPPVFEIGIEKQQGPRNRGTDASFLSIDRDP